MKHSKSGNIFVIKLEPGEEIIGELTEFCRKEKVRSGFFQGIGALNYADIGYFSKEKKNYFFKKFERDMEIANLSGNVAEHEGEIIVHAHITLAGEDSKAFAGHLYRGMVSVTCEIFLTVLEGVLKRATDFETELKLLNLE